MLHYKHVMISSTLKMFESAGPWQKGSSQGRSRRRRGSGCCLPSSEASADRGYNVIDII